MGVAPTGPPSGSCNWETVSPTTAARPTERTQTECDWRQRDAGRLHALAQSLEAFAPNSPALTSGLPAYAIRHRPAAKAFQPRPHHRARWQ